MEEIVVFASVVAIDAVIGAHHRSGMCIADADLKREQVALAHGALGDYGVHDIAAGLLIVDGVVLDISDDMLCLLTGDKLAPEGARQDRVLAEILEGAAVAWFPRKVHPAAERHVIPLRPQLPADHRPILIGSLAIPTRRRACVAG